MDETELAQRLNAWLENPASTDLADAKKTADRWIAAILEAMASDPESDRGLGPLLGRVRQVRRRLDAAKPLKWTPLAGGHLAIGHRPGRRQLEALPLLGVTHILTLLSEREGAAEIADATRRAGLLWLSFPMESAAPVPTHRIPELRKLLGATTTALACGARIYIHCSAGIHRTGYITYLLCRVSGKNPEESRILIGKTREATSHGVGDNRLASAESIVSRLSASA